MAAKQMRRSSFSLIECIVAVSLLALVLTSFASLFWNFSRFEIMIQDKIKYFSKLQMQSSRLQDALGKATYGLEPKYCFYAVKGESAEEVGTSLIFTYDAGVEQDPRFSNINIGKLYLDRDNNLVLASWPDPKLYKDEVPPMRKETLFTNVDSFSMRFFCCKELPKSAESLKPPERGSWTDVWDKEFKMQPQLVEISIKMDSDLDSDATETLVFACVIPRGFPTIEYGS